MTVLPQQVQGCAQQQDRNGGQSQDHQHILYHFLWAKRARPPHTVYACDKWLGMVSPSPRDPLRRDLRFPASPGEAITLDIIVCRDSGPQAISQMALQLQVAQGLKWGSPGKGSKLYLPMEERLIGRALGKEEHIDKVDEDTGSCGGAGS